MYSKNRTEAQFNWEFNSSPAGKAIYVIALDETKIVGTQCLIPYFLIDGNNKTSLSGKSEDTLVDGNYRGKNIFENMYKLLIEESKKAGIEHIWGFTYAQKPFKKLGFEIPFQSSMGLMVLRTFEAYTYYSSLSKTNSALRKFKILGLCVKSRLDYLIFNQKNHRLLKLNSEKIALNSEKMNYLNKGNLFGLKLDEAFLNYRIYNNKYSSNYFQCNFKDNDVLKASMFYTINNGIGYILHIYLSDKKFGSNFIFSAIKQTELNKCSTLRFWGFNHNPNNQLEIQLLKQEKFTFINNGISFVGLNLTENKVNWNDFVLSRMASQGTD